uniref:Protein SYS1 homolog n=1 Tax=Odontella aurita TaxID=265563 RepID=A0A7S4N5B5_9STRA|mmetsp:Transcript_47677/g.144158  ORF Transcript_47677/g.144158 Transcript_47677/m.144158 type:complete len:192 (+) Transcript_47677:140-715(+)|eukprot:CAMPEP_0113555564 /NCGR_PEP_ID=MMETSP0015_2-20120614/16786_1 /TAXON_ID=2838 /ORGANISM="Odontella" /LENGTH=191 /DNA_ID=CAMNT_0000456853 /DNA_START=51 /DNA_END=626 /DNA_ORIENTATION=- /assembly_acc=CAM_ASM_000160
MGRNRRKNPDTSANGGADARNSYSKHKPGGGGGVGGGRSGGGTNNSAVGSAFNPRLIFSQIVALQSFHYVAMGLLIQMNHALFATSVTIDRIFTARYLNLRSAAGWIDNSAVLVASVIGAVLLALVVEKSKKCLDFSVTLFFIHFIACTSYGGIPNTWDWWIVHVIGMIVMILLGEYLCSVREMRDIPLLG